MDIRFGSISDVPQCPLLAQSRRSQISAFLSASQLHTVLYLPSIFDLYPKYKIYLERNQIGKNQIKTGRRK